MRPPRALGLLSSHALTRRRLFEHLGAEHIELEPVRALEGEGVTHLRYRVCR